eukprot:EG_transcript_5146
MVLFDCHRGTALLVCGGSDNVWELCQYSLTADLTIISAEVHNLPLLPGAEPTGLRFVQHQLLKTAVPLLCVVDGTSMRLYALRLANGKLPFGMQCILCRPPPRGDRHITGVVLSDGPSVTVSLFTGNVQTFSFNASNGHWDERVATESLQTRTPPAWLGSHAARPPGQHVTACAETALPLHCTRWDGQAEESGELQLAVLASDEPALWFYSRFSSTVALSSQQSLSVPVQELAFVHTGAASLCLATLAASGQFALYDVIPGQTKVDVRCIWRSMRTSYLRCCSFPGQLWQTAVIIHCNEAGEPLFSVLSRHSRVWLPGPRFSASALPTTEALEPSSTCPTSAKLPATLLPVLRHRRAEGVAAVAAAWQRLQQRLGFRNFCCRVLKELALEPQAELLADWPPFPPGRGLPISFADSAPRPPPAQFYVPLFCQRTPPATSKRPRDGGVAAEATALLRWQTPSPAVAVSPSAPLVSFCVAVGGQPGLHELLVPWTSMVDPSDVLVLSSSFRDRGNGCLDSPPSNAPPVPHTADYLAWNLHGTAQQDVRQALERCAAAHPAVAVSITALGCDGVLFALGAARPTAPARFLEALCSAVPRGCVLLPSPLTRGTFRAIAAAATGFNALLDTTEAVYAAVGALQRDDPAAATTAPQAYGAWLEAMARYVAACAEVYAAVDPQLLSAVRHKR